MSAAAGDLRTPGKPRIPRVPLIVEADDNESLSRAMQGLCIRIARALNAMMNRAGAVFADHYHSRLLKTPTEVVRAIAYVLGNAAHHFGARRDAGPERYYWRFTQLVLPFYVYVPGAVGSPVHCNVWQPMDD